MVRFFLNYHGISGSLVSWRPSPKSHARESHPKKNQSEVSYVGNCWAEKAEWVVFAPVQVFSTCMYMGIFGSGSPKRHRLFSNDEHLLVKLYERAGYMSRADQQRCDVKLVKKYIDKRGQQRCTGVRSSLRESACRALTNISFWSAFWNKSEFLHPPWLLDWF